MIIVCTLIEKNPTHLSIFLSSILTFRIQSLHQPSYYIPCHHFRRIPHALATALPYFQYSRTDSSPNLKLRHPSLNLPMFLKTAPIPAAVFQGKGKTSDTSMQTSARYCSSSGSQCPEIVETVIRENAMKNPNSGAGSPWTWIWCPGYCSPPS